MKFDGEVYLSKTNYNTLFVCRYCIGIVRTTKHYNLLYFIFRQSLDLDKYNLIF